MDPLTIAAIGSVAAPVIGGLLGQNQASKDRAAANEARALALAQYAGITVPEAEKMMLNLQQYQSQGELDPRLEQSINLGPSAMEQVTTDPRLRQAQMLALEQYTQMGQGQMNAADQAAFELARQSAAGEQQARQSAILQEMQQRGQAGSGAELLAKLTANQSGAQMLQNAQLEQAKAMQQARMQALAQQAQLGGQVRQQEFGEQSDIAQAKDLIAKTNAANSQSVGARNIAAQNQAMAANLQNRQNIAAMNTELLNKQQIQNKQLPQQTFQNQMALAAGKAGQYGQQAQAAQNQAGQTAGMWSTIGQGLGTALGSFANKKTDQP